MAAGPRGHPLEATSKALVIINPKLPTGVVRHPSDTPSRGGGTGPLSTQCACCRTQIYDRILFDGAVHIPTATLAPDSA